MLLLAAAGLSEEFRQLLDKSGDTEAIQAQICNVGFIVVNLFALLGDDRKAVRYCLAGVPFYFDSQATGSSPTLK